MSGSGRLRIAWFTPLSSGTGIARFSDAVASALVDLADVEVWAESRADNIGLDWCPVHSLDDPARAAADSASFDLRVFNIGNNPEHHRTIFRAAELSRGIVIVHDKVMQNYFYAQSHDRYRRLMRYYYGRRGSEAAEAAILDGSKLADAEFVTEFPLIETCMWNAEGVITHSDGDARALTLRYGHLLPVRRSHLPVNTRREAAMLPFASRAGLDLPADKIVLVAAGRVGRGKRLETVIAALAGREELRERCVFVVVGGGEADYMAELTCQVSEAGLGASVRFVSEADDRLLHSYIEAADICVNLRYPSTESGSMSLVEQLHHGKAVVVYDIGIYAETPDDVVVKVPVSGGSTAVADALFRLVHDEVLRNGFAARAARFAAENSLPETYAHRLVEFAEQVLASRGELARIDAVTGELDGSRTLRTVTRRARRLARRLARG